MRTIILIAAAALVLTACQPAPSGNNSGISIDSVYACQEAVKARGGLPGASFEQVDAQPGRQPPVKGFVLFNGQRTPFTCSLDGAGQVTSVTIDGQAR